jgi:hypothetical protein
VDDGITVAVLTNLNSARPNQFAQVIAGLVNPALAPPKLAAIEDKQPELAARDTREQRRPPCANGKAHLAIGVASFGFAHRKKRRHCVELPHRQEQ